MGVREREMSVSTNMWSRVQKSRGQLKKESGNGVEGVCSWVYGEITKQKEHIGK